MKAVLISIKPKWCHRIIDGNKTIEVRKSAPKEVPFKVYIYCSAGSYEWRKDPWTTAYFPPSGECTNMSQRVIGEFVCNNVYDWKYDYCDGVDIDDDSLLETGIDREDINIYAKGKTLYGWSISNLKIYDKPLELSEFFKACNKPKGTDCSACIDHRENKCKTITRPPQSWCYVEELNE